MLRELPFASQGVLIIDFLPKAVVQEVPRELVGVRQALNGTVHITSVPEVAQSYYTHF